MGVDSWEKSESVFTSRRNICWSFDPFLSNFPAYGMAVKIIQTRRNIKHVSNAFRRSAPVALRARAGCTKTTVWSPMPFGVLLLLPIKLLFITVNITCGSPMPFGVLLLLPDNQKKRIRGQSILCLQCLSAFCSCCPKLRSERNILHL